MPLFRLLHCKPMKPCEQNIWRTFRARITIFDIYIVQGVDDLINFWQNYVYIWLNYLPVQILAFCIVKQPCEQNIWRTARARIISCIQFGYMV